MKKINRKGNRTSFFSPDKISTQIASALDRDLSTATLAYGGLTGARKFYRKTQKECTLKKYKSSVPNDKLANVAFETFKETNAHMSNFKKEDLDLPSLESDLNLRSQILRSARMICHNILSPLTEDEWFIRTKHSGGTSQGVSFIDTSLEAKFTLPISCNPSINDLVDRYLSFDHRLKERLYNTVEDEGLQKPRYLDTKTSRATTVPKNDETDRMIAIETTWNMFFQQGLMLSMYDRMSQFGLDISLLPEKHKDLARLSSIHGLNSTIDFKSASDCVSFDLAKWLIPPVWFYRLNRVRSSSMIFPDGSIEDLNMFSTMGNAVTFPLETIIFYSLAVATVFQTGLKPGHKRNILPTIKSKKSVSVFGDDCILPTACSDTFMEICESVGFIVNKEKSFMTSKGGFRESCGGDYLHGIDVRAFYLKAPTSVKKSALEPWIYIIMNGLLKKYQRYFGNLTYLYEKEVLLFFQSLFSENRFFLRIVPESFPDDSGLKIGHDLDRFLNCYPKFRTSKIMVSDHGQVSFNYHRFVYNIKRSSDSELRYLVALKSLLIKDTLDIMVAPSSLPHIRMEQQIEFRHRKNGGYVVAKAITPFWGTIANRKYKGK